MGQIVRPAGGRGSNKQLNRIQNIFPENGGYA